MFTHENVGNCITSVYKMCSVQKKSVKTDGAETTGPSVERRFRAAPGIGGGEWRRKTLPGGSDGVSPVYINLKRNKHSFYGRL